MTLEELRALAEKATPGPWKCRKSLHGNKYRTVQFDQKSWNESMYTTSELEPGDARLIAACSPQTILALIDVAEAAAGFVAANPGLNGTGPLRGEVDKLSEALK